MTEAVTPPHGLLIVDKPTGPTSHGLVARARRALGTRKIGHAGTLDPMASGLLVLGVGHATRLLTFVVGADKEYLATVRLGVATSTEDAQGEVTAVAPASAVRRLDRARLAAAMAGLRGEGDQVPSAVSAIKVDGRRAYARVRDGEDVTLAPRRVRIDAFELLDARGPVPAAGDTDDPDGLASSGAIALDLDVRVACSSGTYVRALARDLGAALGVGAHLTALRRTRVGPFTIDEAVTLADPAAGEGLGTDPGSEPGSAEAGPAGVRDAGPVSRLLAPADAARRILPALDLTADEARDLGHGKRVRRGDGPPTAAAFAPDGRLVGVVVREGAAYRPLMNLPEATS